MNTRSGTAPLLLATEHTAQDAGAEAVALALARQRGEPLAAVLVQARDAELEMTAPAAAESADAEAGARREALLARAQAAGVALDLRLRRGPQPHVEILEEAQARGTALLVVRRRGRRGLMANLLIGEMVGKVLAQAPCSVLVTPHEAQLWQRAVLAGVDPQGADPTLPAAAAALAREAGTALHFVCVVPAGAAGSGDAAEGAAGAREAAARALAVALANARGAGGDAAATAEVLEAATPQAGLLAAAQARSADLLVVGRRGAAAAARSGLPLGRGRIGSVAHEVIAHARCPVLLHRGAAATATEAGQHPPS